MRMPEGVSVLYFEMPWGEILAVHAEGNDPTRSFTYSIPIGRLEGFLYAVEQAPDRRQMFRNCVKSGVLKPKQESGQCCKR